MLAAARRWDRVTRPPLEDTGGREGRRRGAQADAAAAGPGAGPAPGRKGGLAAGPSALLPPSAPGAPSQGGGSPGKGRGRREPPAGGRAASSAGRGGRKAASEPCRLAPWWLGTPLLVLGPFLPRRAAEKLERTVRNSHSGLTKRLLGGEAAPSCNTEEKLRRAPFCI